MVRALCLTVLVAMLAACSQNPQMTVPEERDQLHHEYLATHPNGKYNKEIMKGEVARGMSNLEVLASWGLPSVRRMSESGDREQWMYIRLDEHSGRVIGYTLMFQDQTLSKWMYDPNLVAMGILTPEDLIGYGSGGGSGGGSSSDVQPVGQGSSGKRP
jgi:hypothetical protein